MKKNHTLSAQSAPHKSNITSHLRSAAAGIMCAAAAIAYATESLPGIPMFIEDEVHPEQSMCDGALRARLHAGWQVEFPGDEGMAGASGLAVRNGEVLLFTDARVNPGLTLRRIDAENGQTIETRQVEYPTQLASHGGRPVLRHVFATDEAGEVVVFNGNPVSSDDTAHKGYAHSLVYATYDPQDDSWGPVHTVQLPAIPETMEWGDFLSVTATEGSMDGDRHSFKVLCGMLDFSRSTSSKCDAFVRMYTVKSTPDATTVGQKDSPALENAAFYFHQAFYLAAQLDGGLFIVQGGNRSKRYPWFLLKEDESSLIPLECPELPNGVRGVGAFPHREQRIMAVADGNLDTGDPISFRLIHWGGSENPADGSTQLWQAPANPFAIPQSLDKKYYTAHAVAIPAGPETGDNVSSDLYFYAPGSGLARYRMTTTGTTLSAATPQAEPSAEPFLDGTTLRLPHPSTVSIHTSDGRHVTSTTDTVTELDLSTLPPGIFIATTPSSSTKIAIRN